MASAVVRLLAALFELFPKLESWIKALIELADKVNAAEAVNRKAQKDKAVDAAIDRGVSNDCEND